MIAQNKSQKPHGPKPRIRAAGAVIVRPISSGHLFLLLRAYRFWDFPKGECGATEEPFDCALREVLEETGMESLQWPWGRLFYETPPYGRGKVARYYLGRTWQEEVRLGVNPELGRPEHHEARWVSFDEGMALLVPRLQEVLLWARGQIISQKDAF